ncbi:MAG: TRAM domain-containing protein [Actinomycetota bacterium]
MLVEALRLIIVLSAVLAANRLAIANPRLLGQYPNQTRVVIITILGAGIAYIAGGVVARTVESILHGTEERVAKRHASEIIASTLGFLIGGVISAFVAWPLVLFVSPTYIGSLLAAFVAIVVITFSVRLAARKRLELFGVLGVAPTSQGVTAGAGCLLDSSAAIDGRVLSLFRAGLLPQPLCVPAFIIWELQGIADAGDPMRRRRGQRGLDMLSTLREAGVDVKVIDEDPAGTEEPDAKLVIISKRRGLPIVTSDSNLAKAAELQGVSVLNLHRLTEMVRAPVLVGETISVQVVKKGREADQGVGYLDDGTMVVIEGASERVGTELSVEVTSILNQDTGRILFTKLHEPGGDPSKLREVR